MKRKYLSYFLITCVAVIFLSAVMTMGVQLIRRAQPTENVKIVRRQNDKLWMKGYRYYNKGEYKKAVKCFKQSIENEEQGCRRAKFMLGCAYYTGDGVVQNFSKAEKYLTEVIETAPVRNTEFVRLNKFVLGKIKYKQRDYKTAIKYLRRSAKSQYKDVALESKTYLGMSWMMRGKYDKARDYFLRGVNSGDDHMISENKAMLGILNLETGDYRRAVRCLKGSAKYGNSTAMYMLGSLYDEGIGEIEMDKKQARKWYTEAEKAGDGRAAFVMEYINAEDD